MPVCDGARWPRRSRCAGYRRGDRGLPLPRDARACGDDDMHRLRTRGSRNCDEPLTITQAGKSTARSNVCGTRISGDPGAASFWGGRQAQSSPNDDFARENALKGRVLLRSCGAIRSPRGTRAGVQDAAIASRSRASHDRTRGARIAPRRPPRQRIFSSRVRPRGASGGAQGPRPSGARRPVAVRDASAPARCAARRARRRMGSPPHSSHR